MSMLTKLSPHRIVAMMMGVFLLAISASSFISGLLAQLTSVERVGEELTDPAAAMANYQDVFQMMGMIALSVAAVLLILSPFLKKLMHLDKSVEAEEYPGGVVEPE